MVNCDVMRHIDYTHHQHKASFYQYTSVGEIDREHKGKARGGGVYNANTWTKQFTSIHLYLYNVIYISKNIHIKYQIYLFDHLAHEK